MLLIASNILIRIFNMYLSMNNIRNYLLNISQKHRNKLGSMNNLISMIGIVGSYTDRKLDSAADINYK